jgi:hypothetical protein
MAGNGRAAGAKIRDVACELPPMEERTASLYVVGWGGASSMAI